MRRDQRDELASNVPRVLIGVGEMTIDRSGKRRRRSRIPGSGNRGLTKHALRYHFHMSDTFSRDQVASIAALANLDLDANEIELFARQLGDILAYATEVQQVDTAGVPATASVVTRHSADRPDIEGPCLPREEVLAGAPDAARGQGFFKVPRVIG
jgi:aspartyl-tRNA(Asn)/glutamyl-tRNA(Gln) amidotransferase subunit C